jgi:hypothetical protein
MVNAQAEALLPLELGSFTAAARYSKAARGLDAELVPKPGWFWNKLLEKIANSL